MTSLPALSIRSVPESVNRRAWVEHSGDAAPQIDVLANALDLRSVVEIRRTDDLPDDVPVHAGRILLHLHHLHDVQQLRADLPDFPESFHVDKVF
eukprot:CAMPEP_0168354864 /NCGR_PEP_ID=MMETSP0213-20121227/24166_1 /TAXON_ID=151035 /ORGANISM="Euplotes harpa, Strain FSP1.4" /LENGTH=94 /DNA_ID=CAMNT_0008366879 /DNA_START=103 /DNA_END=387 /DNA_ORIENTATION=-